MKPIHKGVEPAELSAYKATEREPGNEGWKARFADPNFTAVRPAVDHALLLEQGWLCAYCGRVFTPTSEGDEFHIDHIVPQSVAVQRDLDWQNLLMSCGGRKTPPPRAARTCGHRRGNRPLKVHPLLSNCRDFFEYRSDGSVTASPKAPSAPDAENTIGILGLDVRRLREARKAAIETALATDPEREVWTVPADDSRLEAYCFVIEDVLQRFRQAIEQR